MCVINESISFVYPKAIREVMDKFASCNYEVYIVGGCVRDSILNRRVNDWDLCTNARPEEIINLCEKYNIRYIPTGLKHGTITMVLNNENYEITTFRIDGDYVDGRHPEEVSFTSSLMEDLARRDFTINALAYNDRIKLVDCFGGIEDIKSRIIRCVGEPGERFREDNLRRLRAIRFACQLNFKIEGRTYEELAKNTEKIALLSIERIREEFIKIILSDNAEEGVLELYKLNMLKYILPELEKGIGFHQHNKHHDKDVFDHILSVVKNVEPELVLRLAALLHDIGKPDTFTMGDDGVGHFIGHEIRSTEIAREALKRLRFDNKTIEKVCILVKYHMNKYDKIKTSSIKRFISRVGKENLEELFKLQIADIKGSAEDYRGYEKVLELRERCNEIIDGGEPLSVKDLEISGHDLIKIGYKPGKEFGEVLNKLTELVLEHPEYNNKEDLINYLRERENSHK